MKEEIEKLIEELTGMPIVHQQRCNWDDHKFFKYKTSQALINEFRDTFDRFYVTSAYGRSKPVKEFFEKYREDKDIKKLNWFDFLVY